MASTYVNDLRLNEMATGDASGSWGTVTNTNLELIAEAFSFGTEAITTNADTHTTTIADGATDPGRSMFLKYTGTLDSACTITIAPNTVSKLWFIENGTSGSQNIIIKQGSGATITIPPGDTKAIYSDGAGSGGKMVDAFASLSVVDLKVQDDLTVTDDMTVGGTLGVTGVLTTTAAAVFNGGFAANQESTIIAADGEADNAYVLTIKNQEATNDRSFGLRIEAGSTATDLPINIETHDGGTALFQLAGSGQARFLDGTASLPSISNLNGPDLNTGIFFPAADVLAFSTGGTERMRVTTDNLLLSQTAPSQDFGDGRVFISMKGRESADYSGVQMANYGTTGNDQNLGILAFWDGTTSENARISALRESATTDAGLAFYTRPTGGSLTERVRIDHDGDVTVKTGTLTIPSQLIHAGDTDTLFEFQGDNSMRFKAGGNEVVEMTGNTVTFNDGSANVDFRVESNGNTHMLYVDGGNNCVNIGNSTDETGSLNITGGKGTGSGIPTGQLTVVDDTSIAAGVGGAIQFKGQFTSGSVTAAGSIEAYKANATDGNYSFGLMLKSRTNGGTNDERLYMDETITVFNDGSKDTDFRVESDGNTHALFVDGGNSIVHIGTSDPSVAGNTGSASGINLDSGGGIEAAAYQKVVAYFNRMNNDGTIVEFRQNGTAEGTISVSGSTVSYNGFAGRHESSGIATSTARGTVVSTIDELDTYPADSTKAGQTRADHAKVKVSDSVGDARVYGVVDDFDENDKLFVVSVGIASVKVTGSCSGGDLLESNGDGTAKVQSDDIVRSKTIGKVTIGNSNTGVKLVSCVMYCG